MNPIFRYLEKEVFRDFTEDVQFITPDVTQLIKLYEGTVSLHTWYTIA